MSGEDSLSGDCLVPAGASHSRMRDVCGDLQRKSTFLCENLGYTPGASVRNDLVISEHSVFYTILLKIEDFETTGHPLLGSDVLANYFLS